MASALQGFFLVKESPNLSMGGQLKSVIGKIKIKLGTEPDSIIYSGFNPGNSRYFLIKRLLNVQRKLGNAVKKVVSTYYLVSVFSRRMKSITATTG